MTIRLALPTGDPRRDVAAILESAGIETPGYESSSRVLRNVDAASGLTHRVFREKDIPVQVALGNYHLGICGAIWLAEQSVRFPLQRVVTIGALPGPSTELWVAGSPGSGFETGVMPDWRSLRGARIASEYASLADLFAVHARIPGYRLLPVYGSAEAYPPDDADIVVLPGSPDEIAQRGLVTLHRFFRGGLVLLANTDALRRADLSALLSRLSPLLAPGTDEVCPPPGGTWSGFTTVRRSARVVRMALPDGHAQRHTFAALADAGLSFDGYDHRSVVRRPLSGVDGLELKVVRPQDMPALVAVGAFDIAVTGRDWLTEHLARFPTSPVEMAVDLRRSRYRIGPVVDQDFPADSSAEALAIWRGLGRPVRIASEYPALAEAFARDAHLFHTAIIPISGASEGFVPEDADVLIEGTETGTSIRANGLKMLDPFMESTNCVITGRQPATQRTDLLDTLVDRLRVAATKAEV